MDRPGSRKQLKKQAMDFNWTRELQNNIKGTLFSLTGYSIDTHVYWRYIIAFTGSLGNVGNKVMAFAIIKGYTAIKKHTKVTSE